MRKDLKASMLYTTLLTLTWIFEFLCVDSSSTTNNSLFLICSITEAILFLCWFAVGYRQLQNHSPKSQITIAQRSFRNGSSKLRGSETPMTSGDSLPHYYPKDSVGEEFSLTSMIFSPTGSSFGNAACWSYVCHGDCVVSSHSFRSAQPLPSVRIYNECQTPRVHRLPLHRADADLLLTVNAARSLN